MAEIFKKLDPALQRWIFRQGWQDLLPVQKAALDPVLEGKSDVIISASTASGKTEAAFLPALTAVNRPEVKKGIRILCVSPLKALINDQYRRLDLMTGEMHLRITPWHGDVGGGHKDQLIKNPDGVLLTTPESLAKRCFGTFALYHCRRIPRFYGNSTRLPTAVAIAPRGEFMRKTYPPHCALGYFFKFRRHSPVFKTSG